MLEETSEDLQNAFKQQLSLSETLEDLEKIRLAFLGKKGKVTLSLKSLGSQSIEVRKSFSKDLNILRSFIAESLTEKKELFQKRDLSEKISKEFEDLSLPVVVEERGCVHPITQVKDELIDIFSKMEFTLEDGPEIETDFNNFTALNINEAHPARQSHDTFYINQKDKNRLPLLLRTHMSTVQIRTMMKDKKALRMIAMGKCYRADYDATHTPMFHQIEGLVLGPDITMAHMKWCLQKFLSEFFEVDKVNLRMRPSYFPFTEPSAEVDIGCKRTKEKLLIGEYDEWLEILGCGMVHPNVLKNCGIDPEEVQGFAFGCGIDRLAMLKYGIPDLRSFFETDKRWLEHYGFQGLDIPSSVMEGIA